MTTLIQTAQSATRPGQVDALLPAVSIGDSPFGPWTPAPHLYVDRLRIAAGPDVDEAQLAYEFGTIQRPDRVGFSDEPPLDLLHRFVQIEVDPQGNESYTWVGVVEVDDREALGANDRTAQCGRQRFVAFGMARLFENVEIRETIVETPDGEPRTIGCGLPFNLAERSRYVRDRGNRSAEKTDGVYLFADAPKAHDQWTAEQALEYLLKHHAPRGIDGEPYACRLKQDGEHLLDWYDVTVPTDRRTLKEVIDQLVARRRGLGYVVEIDRAAVTLRVFSFNDVDIAAEFAPIGKNPNAKRLDYERAVDVERARLVDLALDAFDVLRVEGERQTSTVTLDFACWWRRDEERFAITALADRNQGAIYRFVEDWRPIDERDYVEATSQSDGYAALDLAAQELNDALRREESNLRHVFSRFRLHPRWNQRVFDSDGVWHNVFPVSTLSKDPEPSLDDKERRVQWVHGLKILPFLLLQQGRDYSERRIVENEWEQDDDAAPGEAEPEHPYRHPLLVAEVEGEDGETRTVDAARMNAGVASELGGMRWSIHAHVVDRGPVVALQVAGGPPHFLATSIMADPQPTNFDGLPDRRAWVPGATNDRDDPATQRGLDYNALEITVTIEAQDSVVEEWRPDDEAKKRQAGGDGRQERVLTIRVPEARLDWVVPGTIVAVEEGEAVRTEGGYLRDDRTRLSSIAWAAGTWYGRPRRTLSLTFRQVRTLIRVGDLIEAVGPEAEAKAVNTPVTAVTWDWTGDVPTTSIETNYAAIDFV